MSTSGASIARKNFVARSSENLRLVCGVYCAQAIGRGAYVFIHRAYRPLVCGGGVATCVRPHFPRVSDRSTCNPHLLGCVLINAPRPAFWGTPENNCSF